MSSAVKSLRASDISVLPYKVNKTFTFESSSLYSNDIIIYKGYYDSGSSLENLYKEQLTYFSIKQLYYGGTITGSIDNVSGSHYDNYQQSTAASGTFEYEAKNFPTTQRSEIRVVSIPQSLYGERLKPKHFILDSSDSSYYIVDDGNGNLYDISSLGSPYIVDGYILEDYFINVNTQELPLVGNVFYAHGIAVITNQDYLYIFPKDCTLSSATAYYTPNDCTATGLFAYYIPPSATPSVTPSITISPSVTPSITISVTPSITATPSRTPSITPSITISPSVTPSVTPSISVTPNFSTTPSPTVTRTPSPTPVIFTFMGGTNTFDSANSACINFSSVRGFYTNKSNPTLGDIIYGDTILTSGNEFNGQNRWIALARVSPTNGLVVAYLINTVGVIENISFC